MNRLEFVSIVAKEHNLPKKEAEAIVGTFMETIAKTLKKGQNITFTGFGSFSVKKRAARKGRNPMTGEAIKVKAKKVPVFKAGKTLKELVK